MDAPDAEPAKPPAPESPAAFEVVGRIPQRYYPSTLEELAAELNPTRYVNEARDEWDKPRIAAATDRGPRLGRIAGQSAMLMIAILSIGPLGIFGLGLVAALTLYQTRQRAMDEGCGGAFMNAVTTWVLALGGLAAIGVLLGLLW